MACSSSEIACVRVAANTSRVLAISLSTIRIACSALARLPS